MRRLLSLLLLLALVAPLGLGQVESPAGGGDEPTGAGALGGMLEEAGGADRATSGADRSRVVELEARTFDIADKLRCPVCVSESVAQSSSPISIQMRQIIQQQLQQGRSEAQILAFFQERYGDWILLEPPKRGLHLLVWLLPGVAAVVGLSALFILVRRWTRASKEPIEANQNDLARVREALAERK